ncbi:hypothetical protein PInf_024710 [Phytophthora infestans]|nr:hypothetical protein PInf_024710 [Phytophthora infestans]
MKEGLISDDPVRVAFAVSNLCGRAKHWAYTRETTSPGCFESWAQLCEQLRAALLPANNEFRQRSRFLACKQGKRELQAYVQEMRTLVASLEGNPLPEDVKSTVFMAGLKVGPARTSYSGYGGGDSNRPPREVQPQAGWYSSEAEHRHDENGILWEAEHDAVPPAVTAPIDTGAYSEPEPWT